MTMLVRGGATGSALPTNATTGQVLQWNGSAWVPATVSSSGTTPNASATAPGLVQLAGDLGGTATAPTVAKINGATPAPVATSGAYTDLSGRPALAPVATSGAYTDLTGRPGLAPVATSGSYGDLTNRPLLAPVATSGAYADLTGAPSVVAVQTAYKAAASSVTSSTAKTADPSLQFAAVPVGSYVLEVEGAATANFGWLVTGTATFTSGSGTALSQNSSNNPTSAVVTATSGSTFLNAGTAPFRIAVPVVVTTAGSLAFAWAQTTSSATASQLNAGAWARLTKVA